MRKIAILTVLFLAVAAWLVLSLDVSAAAPAQATAVPAAPAGEKSASFPYLALIILVIPFAIVLWKNSRPGAEKVLNSTSCAPVIDEEALARQKARLEEIEKS